MGRWEKTIIGYFSPTVTKKITTYCEPFVGGGALLFHLQPNTAYINDINPELIRVYTVIKENVDELIEELEKFENTAEQFYAVRDWDRNKDYYLTLTDVQKAA